MDSQKPQTKWNKNWILENKRSLEKNEALRLKEGVFLRAEIKLRIKARKYPQEKINIYILYINNGTPKRWGNL